MYKFKKIVFAVVFILSVVAAAVAQTKSFTPVEGANLKAKIDNAVAQGRSQGRFWVGYQFEVRPGVAIDFEIVGPSGTFSISNDGWSIMDDSRYETRELGLFLFYEGERDKFTRAEIYNLRREHQFSGYPVYWAGRATNEESLNYLKSIIDSGAPEINRLSDRAAFAIALHDDARVESILTEMIKRPVAESIRNRAIYWLGYTPESQAKNTFLADIVRNQHESSDARLQAMSALGMSRAAATLPLLETMYDTVSSRDLKRRALTGIARNDNRDGAATYLIRIAENENDIELRKSAIANLGRVAGEKSLGVLTSTLDSSPELELQKQAVVAIGQRPKDEAIPILIRTARSHPRFEIRKLAIQTLGHTGDERAVAFFKELLGK
ncbi:MAG TPA: HEAT repeat domain-containing protein [Pyrinomonadaceae bacterium]|nr:HEAT repeat domain-containing protein [Pyrinomonadaceae bacterium]